MKYWKINLLLIGLFFLLAPSVFASTITNADYYGLIAITNNGTSSNNVSVPFSLNTTGLINSGFLNSTANNAAIQYNGSDVAFMPGYDPNPWCSFVSSLNANSSLNQYLYTGNVTGGKVRYFPGITGMNTTDAASLEIGNNGAIEQSGYIDTSAGTNKYINLKPGAFSTSVSSYASGNITANVNYSMSANTYQHTYDTDYQVYTVSGIGAYDRNAGEIMWNFPACTIDQINLYLNKFGSPTGTANVTARQFDGTLIGTIGSIDVSTLTGSTATKVFDATPIVNPSRQDIVIWLEYTGGDSSNYVNMAYSDSDGLDYVHGYFCYATHPITVPPMNYPLADMAFDLFLSSIDNSDHVSVTATVASGERSIKTQADGNVLELDIDNPTYAFNGDFEDYGAGPQFYPTSWAIHGPGDGATQATPVKIGSRSASVISAVGGLTYFQQNYAGYVGLRSQTITVGCWVNPQVSNKAYIQTYDGFTVPTAYAVTAGSWQWVTFTTVVNASATELSIYMLNETGGGTAYFDGLTVQVGSTVSPTTTGMINTVSLSGASVADTATNWSSFLNNVMPYTGDSDNNVQRIWVNGTLVQDVGWQYGTTFTDQSGNSNNATPSFRTTSSDADVSASLISFSPLNRAVASNTTIGTGPNPIIGTPTQPAKIFEGNTTGGGTNHISLPGADLINDLLDSSNIPYAIFWLPAILAQVLTASFFAYKAAPSLLLKYAINVVLLIFFTATGVFGGWIVVFFVITGLTIVIHSRTNGL